MRLKMFELCVGGPLKAGLKSQVNSETKVPTDRIVKQTTIKYFS